MRPQALAEFSLFRGLTTEQLAYLASLFSPITFKDGETIFAQGNPALMVYVLAEGLVVLQFQPADGEQRADTTLPPGSVLGWSAVLGRPYYTSSAVCVARTRAIAIPGEKLRALVRTNPELSVLLGRMALNLADRETGALHQIIQLINEELNRAAA